MPLDIKDHLKIDEIVKSERKESDEKYAIKLVEKIVFGLVTLIVVSVFTALVATVLK